MDSDNQSRDNKGSQVLSDSEERDKCRRKRIFERHRGSLWAMNSDSNAYCLVADVVVVVRARANMMNMDNMAKES